MGAFATPTDEAAIREAVLDASAQGTGLRIIAGGTRSGIGRPGKTARALDMSGFSGITRYDPGSLILEAKAGTPIAEIEAALQQAGQMLAFEPMDHRALMGSVGAPTIGGVVACNVSGSRRFLSGACRDFLLGLRFVDGTGRALKNGGRVMKNVTGLDLTRLNCGAYGTLGVLTHVSLKVLPRPQRAASLHFPDLDLRQALGVFCRAVRTPFEVSGAAWRNGSAYLRVEGLPMQVDHRLSGLRRLFAGDPVSVLEGDGHEALWTAIRDVHLFSGDPDTIWKIALRPTDAPALVATLQARLGARALVDQGGALIWLAVPSDAPGQAAVIRGAIPAGAGHATLVRGSRTLRGSVPVFQPQHPRLEQISAGLRHQFDPRGILNPGLMAA